MTQIDELIKEIQDQNVPVSSLLRKAKVLASKLDQTDFLNWINSELDGYKDDETYPDYRSLSGQIKALNPYHGWVPVLFKKSEIEKTLSTRKTKQSVPEIEELLSNKSGSYEMPYPASAANQILRDSPIKTKVSLFLDGSTLVGVLNTVRNTLFDWALKLQKEGIRGEESEFTEREKEQAHNVEPKYNIGSIENFHGNIGEKNKNEEKGGTILPYESFWSKFLWYGVIALIVLTLGNILSVLILKNFFGI